MEAIGSRHISLERLIDRQWITPELAVNVLPYFEILTDIRLKRKEKEY